MKANVLIVEDVREMAELISLYLHKEGMETTVCETAEQAEEVLKRIKYDLIVLDLNLPEKDGFEFLQQIRRKEDIPVLIVSARDSDEDVIMGLGIGADDYVTKPFSPKVLAAKVRAHLRRYFESLPEKANIVTFGPYTLNLDACLLKKGNQRIRLSTREFDVLAFLVSNPERAFSPEAIYREVWKNEYGDVTAVAVYIQRLRRKIEENAGNPRYLETVHGFGYRFNPEGRNQEENKGSS
ncbi:MAG: DNA-binding response regulator [Spirochaetes bacterium]|nr:MAG: DNA-binding response regulator [Spirochaetota bacterium]